MVSEETVKEIFGLIRGIHSAMAEENKERGQILEALKNIGDRDIPAAPCLTKMNAIETNLTAKINCKMSKISFTSVVTIIIAVSGAVIAGIKGVFK